ncbi:MAG: hypothetical protein GTN62_12370 [Gemmatimonadales bacterium]|nr:hypothetical protein [Gemmatimonadales bacterium]NIN12520.1 hypothetical protein [Gemmatimonadales bacterium]NIN50891.1 hypothetical protein [Gemmatimonadales bacterium]NIP08355.1 hypothetical protein [Gemmatimonadales bacterium]NIR03452.1 hypothetical protein [Gemmatimonadales bacterium]
MAGIRSPSGSRRWSAVVLCIVAGIAATGAKPPLRDAPVAWHEDDRRDIPAPKPRDLNRVHVTMDASFFRPLGRLFHPGRFVRRVGTIFGGDHVPPAANLNTLDEVPNSSWFTNRIGLFPTTPEEAARGPMTGPGPDRSGKWTVVGAKTEGVSPGFTIEDIKGDVYAIKFDPPGYLGTTTAAGVISGRILHTAGYNVPEDGIVTFRREQLVLGDDVEFTLPDGTERLMTRRDLDSILQQVEPLPDGTWRALASKWLDGVDMGPFDWKGRRKDDPNDQVRHENRRELRGLRMFAAWLCHFDTKQENTVDFYVEEDGRRFLRHYLLDFASTLGAGALGPFPTACWEYSWDFLVVFGRAMALGLYEDHWRRVERPPGLDEIGYFQGEIFHPMAFKPTEPNTAFANLTDRDGYWAAKIISAFSDEHLEAVVAEGRYRNPAAARWIVRALGERRDTLARYWFDRVAPLDFFTYEGGMLRFRDLGAERGIYPGSVPQYRVRVAATTPQRSRGTQSDWVTTTEPAVDLERAGGDQLGTHAPQDYPFLAAELQVSRGGRWSSSLTVYVARGSGRVVELER